jgi:hypothetical protein
VTGTCVGHPPNNFCWCMLYPLAARKLMAASAWTRSILGLLFTSCYLGPGVCARVCVCLCVCVNHKSFHLVESLRAAAQLRSATCFKVAWRRSGPQGRRVTKRDVSGSTEFGSYKVASGSGSTSYIRWFENVQIT